MGLDYTVLKYGPEPGRITGFPDAALVTSGRSHDALQLIQRYAFFPTVKWTTGV